MVGLSSGRDETNRRRQVAQARGRRSGAGVAFADSLHREMLRDRADRLFLAGLPDAWTGVIQWLVARVEPRVVLLFARLRPVIFRVERRFARRRIAGLVPARTRGCRPVAPTRRRLACSTPAGRTPTRGTAARSTSARGRPVRSCRSRRISVSSVSRPPRGRAGAGVWLALRHRPRLGGSGARSGLGGLRPTAIACTRVLWWASNRAGYSGG